MFIVMIDVCSCSIDVWEGIKSYVQAIVKKIHRDIGIGDETVHVSIIQVICSIHTLKMVVASAKMMFFSIRVQPKPLLVLVM